jgi:hypothetical protein
MTPESLNRLHPQPPLPTPLPPRPDHHTLTSDFFLCHCTSAHLDLVVRDPHVGEEGMASPCRDGRDVRCGREGLGLHDGHLSISPHGSLNGLYLCLCLHDEDKWG